jgi:homoserine dehydrogenase
MNGSCNYILTRMEDAGMTYEEVFAEADGLGYLEADPNLDVGGIERRINWQFSPPLPLAQR